MAIRHNLIGFYLYIYIHTIFLHACDVNRIRLSLQRLLVVARFSIIHTMYSLKCIVYVCVCVYVFRCRRCDSHRDLSPQPFSTVLYKKFNPIIVSDPPHPPLYIVLSTAQYRFNYQSTLQKHNNYIYIYISYE